MRHGLRSSFKDWARQHDVDELLSEFALAHVEGSATVAAYARDDLLEKVVWWTDAGAVAYIGLERRTEGGLLGWGKGHA